MRVNAHSKKKNEKKEALCTTKWPRLQRKKEADGCAFFLRNKKRVKSGGKKRSGALRASSFFFQKKQDFFFILSIKDFGFFCFDFLQKKFKRLFDPSFLLF